MRKQKQKQKFPSSQDLGRQVPRHGSQKHKHLAIFCCFFRHISRERDRKWRRWDSNWHSYRILVLLAVAEPLVPTSWPLDLLPTFFSNSLLSRKSRLLFYLLPRLKKCQSVWDGERNKNYPNNLCYLWDLMYKFPSHGRLHIYIWNHPFPPVDCPFVLCFLFCSLLAPSRDAII